MFKSPASNLPSWKQLSKELARWAQVRREGGKGHERRKTFEDHFSISNDLRQRVLFRISLLTLPGRTDESVSLQFIFATTHWNLNTAQAVHIFVLVHVKQVCQVFPAPTPECVVQMKWNTASGILPSNEHKQRDSTNFCVCVVYTTLPPRASMKLRCSIFDQFLGRKTGCPSAFQKARMTWHGWNEATNLTDWCEQAGISDYFYTYTSYFILSSTHGSRW